MPNAYILAGLPGSGKSTMAKKMVSVCPNLMIISADSIGEMLKGRQTWESFQDCETIEEVIDWLSELEAAKQVPFRDDSDDRSITEIREIKDEELFLSADPEKVKRLVELRKKMLEKEKEDAEKASKAEELKRLRELKKKYPEAS
jgi:tRNA uridine 5-carbamoylmethylation protein Kti12